MEKKTLGRGLAALIPETYTPDPEAKVRDVPVKQVVPNPYQPRTLFDPLKMEELVASIREMGVLQPILVRELGHERFQIVAGERRFRAAQVAGLTSVPALVRDCTEQELLEMAVVENVQREDIGVMESARAYQRMLSEFNMTQETIAQRVGKSRAAIANTLRLLKLPEEVQDSLERGEISEGHGRALMMAATPPDILNAWRSVVKRQLSVRDTENLARDYRHHSDTPTSPAIEGDAARNKPVNSNSPDAHDRAATERLQEALAAKVSLRYTGPGKGRIEIAFDSMHELNRLLEILAP